VRRDGGDRVSNNGCSGVVLNKEKVASAPFFGDGVKAQDPARYKGGVLHIELEKRCLTNRRVRKQRSPLVTLWSGLGGLSKKGNEA